MFSAIELMIRDDGAIYHLGLKPDDVPDTIITVGDPERVQQVSRHLDRKIGPQKGAREFVSQLGVLRGHNILVLSTGIGTDNLDIVINELDALANIDFATRAIKSKLRQLAIVRIGTTSSLLADIPIGSYIVSQKAIGMDALLSYYEQKVSAEDSAWVTALHQHLKPTLAVKPYIASADPALLQLFPHTPFFNGVTLTTPGFYGPQGRFLRAKPYLPNLLEQLQTFPNGPALTNFEMETAGLYGLSTLLGHRACSCSLAVGNRATGDFLSKIPSAMDTFIDCVLSNLA